MCTSVIIIIIIIIRIKEKVIMLLVIEVIMIIIVIIFWYMVESVDPVYQSLPISSSSSSLINDDTMNKNKPSSPSQYRYCSNCHKVSIIITLLT